MAVKAGAQFYLSEDIRSISQRLTIRSSAKGGQFPDVIVRIRSEVTKDWVLRSGKPDSGVGTRSIDERQRTV
jgi:TATA-box binding protein (TBP) (component of TFIID and TFIIIB)